MKLKLVPGSAGFVPAGPLVLQRILVLIFLVTVAAGCSSKPKTFKPVVDPELVNVTKEQAFEKAEKLMEDRKYTRARTFYTHVYENYPNDPLGRRSLLRVADSYFKQGDVVNLVEAQYKYRDFINRYPGSESADYAMLQIAMVSFKQMERPDRDQQKTREAEEKLNDMIRAYPRSSLKAEAEARLRDVHDHLGTHEHMVAKYYIKRGSLDAAVRRLNYLIDTYPNFKDKDAAFYDLATALERLGRKGEARLYYERIVAEFPKGRFAERAKKRLGSLAA